MSANEKKIKTISLTRREFPGLFDKIDGLVGLLEKKTGVPPSRRKLAAELVGDAADSRAKELTAKLKSV